MVYRATNDVKTDSRDRPLEPVTIVDSGSLPLSAPFKVAKAGVGETNSL